MKFYQRNDFLGWSSGYLILNDDYFVKKAMIALAIPSADFFGLLTMILRSLAFVMKPVSTMTPGVMG